MSILEGGKTIVPIDDYEAYVRFLSFAGVQFLGEWDKNSSQLNGLSSQERERHEQS